MTSTELTEVPVAPTTIINNFGGDDDPTGGRLVAWAQAARAAATLGAALSSTSFVPKAFQGKPAECAAAVMLGDEIGLSPMQAVQAIFVISGKPGLYARAMVAIVLAAGHHIETVIKTDDKVTVRGRRKGSENWIEETWTLARAQRAGYATNAKYKTDPQSMLYARAAGDICRQIAPDALAGIGYSVEELELSESAAPVTVSREAVPSKVQRRPRAVTSAPTIVEPSFDDDAVVIDIETGEVIEDEATPETVTKEQIDALTEALRKAGYTNRAMMLAYLVQITGNEALTSANDMTLDELLNVMATLGGAA